MHNVMHINVLKVHRSLISCSGLGVYEIIVKVPQQKKMFHEFSQAFSEARVQENKIKNGN